MHTLSGKIITALLSLFLLLYVGYQGYRYYYFPIKTETALSYTIQDTTRLKGLIVRDEQVLEENTAGVVAYYNEDGAKVTYGTPVAEVYAAQEDVTNKRRIKDLETEIAKLQSIQNPGNNYYLNSEAISKQINECLYALLATNESGSLLELAPQKVELLSNLNKKQLAMGIVNNFDDKMNALTAEKASLEAALSGGAQVISAPSVGYFSSYSDGMEQVLSVELLKTITVEQVEEYLAQDYEQDNSKIGKIIRQKPWYFVTAVSEDDAVMMPQGRTLTIDFGIPSFRDVPATIETVRMQPQEHQAVVIMSCDYMCPQLTRLRNPSAELKFQMYTGLKIPNQAVRFRNEERGVFVNTGSEIKFKKIDVIYEGAGYVLSKLDELDPECVHQFDDIVVEGSDLEDGKPAPQV